MNTTDNSASTPVVAATSTEVTATPETTTTPAATPAQPKVAPTAGSTVRGKIVLVAAKDKQFALLLLDGGFTGLLHESQLNGNTRQERNSRLQGLKRDQELDVLVQEVTEKEGKTRISLSERALALSTALSALAVGTDVTGRVQNKEKYGAFVDLGNGLSGLLHVGSLPGNKPAERDSFLAGMQKDQVVKVRVTKVETVDRKTRIALVLTDVAEEKQRTSAAHEQRMEQLRSGAVTKGTMMGTKDGFYLIGLGCGLSGLLPMDEVSKLVKGGNVRVKLASADGRNLLLTRKGIA